MIGYLDLPSGISGDMFLGCLVDAGWPVERLRETVQRLGLSEGEWSVDAAPVMKGPLRAMQVTVAAAEGHHHRHLADIRRMIESADLPERIEQRAVAVFTRLADAEAKVHGSTVEKVHFHEVGAVDAIIDIVGTVMGLEALGIERLHASAVPLGAGWADTDHGRIPLPAPATLEILAAAGAPTRPAPGEGEWVTPTGAALLCELAEFGQPAMQLGRIASGAGRKDCPWPNVARLWLGTAGHDGALVQLETNIDDMNPQFYEAVSRRLFEAGALDVWLTPIQMKKGRPGVMLSVLAPAARQPLLCERILRETTTLGIRVHRLEHRHEAKRETRTVETPYGGIRIKLKWVGEDCVGAAPEYDDCLAAAEKHDTGARQVHDAALEAALPLIHRTSADDAASHEHGCDHHHAGA